MNQQSILNELRAQLPMLQEKYFVTKMAIFGSFARNEATDHSDIDILVQLTPPVNEYMQTKEALRNYLIQLFNRKVDLANPRSLKPHIRERILQQAVYV